MVRRFCIAIVTVALLHVLLPAPSGAQDQLIFVDVNATSAGDGTSDRPFRAMDAAIAAAGPGDTIRIKPGVYPSLRIENLAGTSQRPIRIEAAGPGVIFQDPELNRRYAVILVSTAHLHLVGFETRRGIAGVMVQASRHITLESLRITGTGQEGIHIQDGSHDIDIFSNYIADTGNRTDKVGNFPVGQAPGEGIYLGNGRSGGTDRVWNIRIIGNEITKTTHEAIDVKTPAHDIQIIDNYIHDIATFVTGAVVFHINENQTPTANITFERNVVNGVRSTSQYRDGNCLVTGAAATITNNVFANCQHRGVFVERSFSSSTDRNVTIAHNTFYRAGTSIEVRSGSPAVVTAQNNLGTSLPGNRPTDGSEFASADRGDFSLVASSPSIDTATPIGGIDTDLTGGSRVVGQRADYGAIEFRTAPPASSSSGSSGQQSTATTAPPTTAPPTTAASPSTTPTTTAPPTTAASPSTTPPTTANIPSTPSSEPTAGQATSNVGQRTSAPASDLRPAEAPSNSSAEPTSTSDLDTTGDRPTTASQPDEEPVLDAPAALAFDDQRSSDPEVALVVTYADETRNSTHDLALAVAIAAAAVLAVGAMTRAAASSGSAFRRRQ